MTTPRPLTIVSIAAEVAPFSKTGGLGDVASSLPEAISRLGHRTIVVTPFYQFIASPSIKQIASNILFSLRDATELRMNIYESRLDNDTSVYFIEHPLLSRVDHPYNSDRNNERFYIFDHAVFALLKHLQIQPDILHCHDWHTGLIPEILNRSYRDDPSFMYTAAVLTIHNLAFQMGSPWKKTPKSLRDDGNRPLPPLSHRAKIRAINFMRRGIMYADILNAVSEQYAQEIQTNEYGEYLERLLKNRNDRLFGIVNGIDVQEYNPETDPGIRARFSARSIWRKATNKEYLQRRFRLPLAPHIPLIGMVTRFTRQKGFDILMRAMGTICSIPVQLVVFGGGDKKYEDYFAKMAKKHPKRIAAYLKFNTEDATKIYAGSDIFLMPSRFEPCGITQLIAMRYGTIPVARATGGLIDTIQNYQPFQHKGRGNGFIFRRYHSQSLIYALTRAIETYRRPAEWEQLVTRVMQMSFSWEIPAKRYLELFRTGLKRRRTWMESQAKHS
ncbi:MAG: glycogen/starch synthase [Patescibacteria group bacterium]